MSTSTYVAIMMPILMTNAYRNSGGGGNWELGVFGTTFVTISTFGIMAFISYIAWDMREEKVSVFFALFCNLILFLIWCGVIFTPDIGTR